MQRARPVFPFSPIGTTCRIDGLGGYWDNTLTMNRFLRLVPFFSLIASAILAVTVLATPPPVQAQENPNNWVDGGYAEEMYSARTTGSVSQSPYTVRSFDTPMYRTIENILGPVPGITITMDIMQKDPKYAQQMLQKSAVAGIGNYIAMIYANPPADLALWIRDTGQTLGFLPKQVYAQGVGFSGLAPLLPIWKAFRNIAYLLLAIVMIVIGFMVMLRKKIDPKTVVTVQNAIPRIVITLLLITFSYAIVGIMIDLMYLLIAIAVVLIKNTGLLPELTWFQKLFNFQSHEQAFTTGTLPVYVSMLFPWGIGSILDTVYQIFGLGGTITAGVTGAGIGALVGAAAGPLAIPGAVIGLAAGAGGVQILVAMLVSLFLLFLFIRLFVLVLSAYINIVLALIIGPIQLLAGAMPGSNAFASWMLNLTSNMLTFPIIGVMGMIAIALGTAADKYYSFWTGGNGQFWTPPYGISGGNAQSISALFSLGILMAIPQVVGSVKEALKAKAAVPLTGAFGQAISSPAATGMQLLSTAYYIRGFVPDAIWKKVGLGGGGGPTHSPPAN